jgi:hypothetical protein
MNGGASHISITNGIHRVDGLAVVNPRMPPVRDCRPGIVEQ